MDAMIVSFASAHSSLACAAASSVGFGPRVSRLQDLVRDTDELLKERKKEREKGERERVR